MTHQDSSIEHGEAMESAKKLRKRERRLKERIQEAQIAYEQAIERLQHAEARVQKRTARLQRLTSRLEVMQQQQASSEAVAVPEQSAPLPTDTQPEAIPTPSPLATIAQPAPPTFEEIYTATIAPSLQDEAILTEPEKTMPLAELSTPEAAIVAPAVSAPEQESLPAQSFHEEHALPIIVEQPEETPQAVLLDTPVDTPEIRAVAQSVEETARLAIQRVEIANTPQELNGDSHHLLAESARLDESVPEQQQEIAQEALLTVGEKETYWMPTEQQYVDQLQTTLPSQPSDIDNEQIEAFEETYDKWDDDDETDEDVFDDDDEDNDDEDNDFEDAITNEPPVFLADFDAPAPSLIADYERTTLTRPEVYQPPTHFEEQLYTAGERLATYIDSESLDDEMAGLTPHNSLSVTASVKEIEEEEHLVDAITAMMIADVATAKAAKAEAYAEECSMRTREARAIARQADLTLRQVQAIIKQNTLYGYDAGNTLRAAEREAARAHAALADAEIQEEQAVRTAMHAEAEAELAEEMTYTNEIRSLSHTIAPAYYPHAATPDLHVQEQHPYDNEDDDITLEMPVILHQESA